MSDHWFQQFAGRFAFPDNYTCIDLETNGTNPERSAICVIGITVVRNNQPVSTDETYLNWPDCPDIDPVQFQEALQATETALRGRNQPFHHTWDRLQALGEPPRTVLENVLKMCEAMEARREILIAHNGWRFDIELLQAHFHNWLDIPFLFDPDLVYDTGIAEKASQLDDDDDPLPLIGETMQQFAWRIGALRRRGIFWALDRYCDQQYALFEKAGIDRSQAHSAGADSLLVHYLMQEHKRLADAGRIARGGA